ncbi:WG repeat-containing protein [Hymenobacter persicinus]|uniref:WG repeat-containing protein n=1 Tax=Hymenobacter persicinus TaxID=2025506 RepID=A0A4Q5L9X2_9BACT|nr:WG repeat-containing protein [Hymenobacter persicinus]RYU78368.1 hypothetical protein EWM57_14450 [Hymenobacter persicinus]
MLHVCLFAPFASAARQTQFEAVRAALAAESQGPATLLLGNLPVAGTTGPDAVLIRPRSITLLLLEPRGGRLTIRDFAHAAWQLDGHPLTGGAEADNPFQQFSQQKEELQRFLRPYLTAEQANLNFITGLLLFGEPVVFGREVEERMAAVPAAATFHLLADPSRFTRRLQQLASPEIDLTEADITHLAQQLIPTEPPRADVDDEATASPTDENLDEPAATAPGFWQQKAGQLWRWLGAHDVDDLDAAPYGGYEEVEARQQEKRELEQLRTTLQAEVAAQLRAMEARELERERSLAQLREKLGAAPAVAPEAAALQARIAAESREKEMLAAAMQASRAESEARNRELDAKIQQLSELMAQMQTVAAPGPTPSAAAAPAASSPVRPDAAAAGRAHLRTAAAFGQQATRASWRQLRQWRRRLPRLGVVAAGLAVLVLAVWAFRSATAGPPRAFQQRGQWGLVEADGDTLVPARYTSLGEFHEGRAVVEKQGAFGLLNDRGEETIAPAYDALNPPIDGFARVRIGDLYTFVEEQGEEFTQYYFNALDFSEGRAAVLDRRGWFYISGPAPETKPPVLFQEAYSFHQGLARVKLGGAYTFITPDYLDHPTPDFKPFGRYSDAGDFTDGRARVVQNGRTFYIDKDGEPVE